MMDKILLRRRIRQLAALSLIAATVGLTACAGLKNKQQPISDVLKVVPAQGYKPDAHYGNLSLQTAPQVDGWIRYFTGRGRKYMHLYLERSARYMPLMRATFRERGMPDELAYVAMIESGLNANAFSRASAVGYWQFVRGTGKRYNLRIDRYVDERRDPILSTEAAASYLDSLYSIFGDWYLALAAYNAGEQRIMNAVMRYHTRDFWELAHYRRALPRETKNYIPKFIAAVLIAEHPKEYGFNDIDLEPVFTFDSVVIDKPISLETLAARLHVEYDELKLMNPRYKSDYVPVYADRINAIRVPVGMKKLAMADLPDAASSGPKHYIASFEYYRIRRGDNLVHIARRFHTSVARLLDLNNLARHSLIRAGRRLKVPEGFSASGTTRHRAGWRGHHRRMMASIRRRRYHHRHVVHLARHRRRHIRRRLLAVNHGRVHVVRRGENLSVIARRYRVSISQIAHANSIHRHSKLLAGTELIIPDRRAD